MPFTPKFVDLVRNATSVQGTGPVTLGAAVSGFTGFAAAVSAGEQFYYCIQSLERPAEREVGRGTMQANGTIARDPVSGSLTSFTSGSKTIALVTAAEWFSRIEAMPAPGAPFDVASRGALTAASTAAARPAFLCEKGREGLFVFDPSNLSARVAADSAQGVYVAPASAPSGASGAWVRQYDGALRLEWFGAVAGDFNGGAGSDCLPAWNAAMAYLAAVRRNENIFYAGLPEILFPGAQYYFGDTLQLKLTVRLRGMGSGHSGGAATILRFPADKAGIVVQRYNTIGDGLEAVATRGGDGSIIEGFYLYGGGGAADLLKSGVRMRARATVRDCLIGYFAGAGVCIHADVSVATTSPYYGNANNWRLDNVRAQQNKSGGFHVQGADANAGLATLCDASSNGRFGFLDKCFLGNTWVGCHSDANGMFNIPAGLGETSVVHFGGTRYYLVNGQEALAATTTPGTNSAVWASMGAGTAHPNIPTWDGTQAYVAGGAYLHTGLNNFSKFDGCYTEGGQAPPQILGNAIVDGGLMGDGANNGAPHLVGSVVYGLKSQKQFTQRVIYGDGSRAMAQVGGDMSVASPWVMAANSTLANPAIPDALCGFRQTLSSGDWEWVDSGGMIPLRITNVSTARTYGGRTQAESRAVVEVPQMMLGFGQNSGGNLCLNFKVGSAAPSAGRHAIGDVVWNTGTVTSINTVAYWRCTTAGTPGTWTAYGPLSQGPAIGYASGAGGTITQATSKVNTVNLSKASGQIVMHAASLAPGASVTFLFQNSFIQINDTVIVNIASGATLDSYTLDVVQIVTSGCRIQLRNVSAAALAEPVVLNFAVVKGVVA